MKAFLLAAGLGTRLRPLTNNIPKCLLPINGKPLLQLWLELLGKHGIEEVLLNTHWHADKVEGFVEEAEKIRKSEGQAVQMWPSLRLFYEEILLGSAGTIWKNRDWVSDGMIHFHEQHTKPFTLGVFKSERPKKCGIAEVDAEGVVTGFVEKPENPKSDLAAAGIYVAEASLFDFYPGNAQKISPLDLGFHVLPNLIGKMKAYVIEDFLMDIGTPDSYAKAKETYPPVQGAKK
ncbi:MAG: nucleotidyltransferase family protein [Deltaproteobacteria bacterium]|jgi:mannose-1-phosphate guanylyltransferase|nr:nucleotidyltransferase family protein [Deltaproteobacteria bacterium]